MWQKRSGRGCKKDVMERSLAYLPLYDALDTVKIDVSGKALGKIAEEIMHIKESVYGKIYRN